MKWLSNLTHFSNKQFRSFVRILESGCTILNFKHYGNAVSFILLESIRRNDVLFALGKNIKYTQRQIFVKHNDFECLHLLVVQGVKTRACYTKTALVLLEDF